MSSVTAKLIKTLSGYTIEIPEEMIRIEANRFSENRREISAELKITTMGAPGVFPLLFFGRQSLMSVAQKSQLIKELKGKFDLPDWSTIIEMSFMRLVEKQREGEAVVLTGNKPVSQSPSYRIWPIMPEGLPTILFGDGGSCKSYLALLLSLVAEVGEPRLGLNPLQGKVLYLDYEAGEDEINTRWQALARGLGIDKPPDLAYRWCSHPIEDEVEILRTQLANFDAKMLVVDSLDMAVAGNSLEAEPVLNMFRAVRYLNVSSLLVDHNARNTQADVKAPYGSVYKVNAARSVWEAKKDQQLGENTSIIGLRHRKVNSGHLRHPLGFKFTFANGPNDIVQSVLPERYNAMDSSDIRSTFHVGDQIRHLLADGAKTAKELAELIGKSDNNIRAVLSDQLKGQVAKLPDGSWGLAAREEPQGEIPF